jgi:glutaredoxin
MAVGILKKLNIEYKNIDITLDNTLYEEVQNITGSHTVPQVFI